MKKIISDSSRPLIAGPETVWYFFIWKLFSAYIHYIDVNCNSKTRSFSVSYGLSIIINRFSGFWGFFYVNSEAASYAHTRMNGQIQHFIVILNSIKFTGTVINIFYQSWYLSYLRQWEGNKYIIVPFLLANFNEDLHSSSFKMSQWILNPREIWSWNRTNYVHVQLFHWRGK